MNSRFAVAVHVLVFLHREAGVAASSDRIAGSVNTNPTLIRRLLSRLSRAGLTTSLMGAGGGAVLARSGETITLLAVHQAVDPDGYVFAMHQTPDPECPVGGRIRAVLEPRIDAAEAALKAELGRSTIAMLAAELDGAAAG